jgi:hypothetical protein
MKVTIFSLSAAVIYAVSSLAGQASYSGAEPWLWKERHHAVVVAVINDVKTVKVPEKNYEYHTGTLVLKVSLAGECDPSLTPSLPIKFVADLAGSSNHTVPTNGSVVLAFISVGWPRADENWVEEAVIGFMPGDDGSGLVVIEGLNDPRVDATLKRIQMERAGQVSKSDRQPTTKPK